MKKVLALIMILGLASVANANLMLTINGKPAPDEITIYPSDWIEIDVEVPDGIQNQSYDLDIHLSNAQAHFLEPVWVPGAGPQPGHWDNINFPTTYTQAPSTCASVAPQNIRIMGVMNTSVGDVAYPGDVIMNELMMHCDETTPVILTLVVHDDAGMLSWDTSTWTEVVYTDGQILGSVTIYQPEPMTLSLLGLGGLALIRRRRS